MMLLSVPLPGAAEDLTNALRAYLQQRLAEQKANGGIVVGLVDERGSRVVGCGKLDNATDQEVNGDTLFCLHSLTGVFTRLLLQNMIARGEVKFDDPVQRYLPQSVSMPSPAQARPSGL